MELITVTSNQTLGLFSYFASRISSVEISLNSEQDKIIADTLLKKLSSKYTVVGPSTLWHYFCHSFSQADWGRKSKKLKDIVSDESVHRFFSRDKEKDFVVLNNTAFFKKYKISQNEIFTSLFQEPASSYAYDLRSVYVKNPETVLYMCHLTTSGYSPENVNCAKCTHCQICRLLH